MMCDIDPRTKTCRHPGCGQTFRRITRKQIRAGHRAMCWADPSNRLAYAVRGPGYWTASYLMRWGVVPARGCGCQDQAAEMNRQGPAWCLEHIDGLADYMLAQAKRRSLAARLLVAVRPRRARQIVRRIVRWSCKMADRTASRVAESSDAPAAADS